MAGEAVAAQSLWEFAAELGCLPPLGPLHGKGSSRGAPEGPHSRAAVVPRAGRAGGAYLASRLKSKDKKALGKKKIYCWLGLEVSLRQ